MNVKKKAKKFIKNTKKAAKSVKKILPHIPEITGQIMEKASQRNLLFALGPSPLELDDKTRGQLKRAFPIPREQRILWADAKLGWHPSGIAITNRGIFIRAKEQLLFYRKNELEPAWFSGTTEAENAALAVTPPHAERFISVCREFAERAATESAWEEISFSPQDGAGKIGAAAGAGLESAETAVFAEQKAHIRNPQGHGEMAEEANTLLDRLHGLDAKVIGRDNRKDGADRQIGDILIQSKYHQTPNRSLESCFDSQTGLYRYLRDGEPMQLEVPKDQYEKVLEGFRKKIAEGKVPGVTDPADAEKIVRKGRLTYRQAVNLTKPGTIESLTYDAATGAVICSYALGITFVSTVFFAWRKTNDIEQAIQAGASAGLQVFGITFVQHMLVSQLARTGLADALIQPSQYIVEKLGYQTAAKIVNAIRALSGKGAIHGAAASKQLAKILRSNVLTSALSFAVFSVPDTYRIASRKISAAQYTKNISVLAASLAGGAGGTVAAGAASAKIAAAAGTAVAPGVGTAIGIIGGFVGGSAGAKITKTVGDLLHEDDSARLGRLWNAYVSCMIGEYLLDEAEIDTLIARLNGISPKKMQKHLGEVEAAEKQEKTICSFLRPHFDAVAAERKPFSMPSAEEILEAVAEMVEEA